MPCIILPTKSPTHLWSWLVFGMFGRELAREAALLVDALVLGQRFGELPARLKKLQEAAVRCIGRSSVAGDQCKPRITVTETQRFTHFNDVP